MAESVKSAHKNAARSRYLIKQAFAQLMNEKDIQKITVTDIVERANISRGTFYAHYLDVYDLSVAIQNNVLETIDSEVNRVGIRSILYNPTDLFHAGMLFLEENKSYFSLYVTSSLADTLINRITNRIKENYFQGLLEQLPPEETKEVQMFAVYSLGAIINVVIDWFKDDIPLNAVECADYLSQMYLISRPEAVAKLKPDTENI